MCIRDSLFTGPNAIPLIANSKWTKKVALSRFPSAQTEVVPLGLDHELFKPLQKDLVRRLLGLPLDKPIVAIGAVDVDDRRKCGPIFLDIHRSLHARDDVSVIIIGNQSIELPSACLLYTSRCV